MHEESKHFLRFVASSFKKNFILDKLVLDVGSYNFNGTNRELFDKSCTYYGNDVATAENVNLPYVTSELPFFEPTFDTIVSSECFQNDPEYVKSFQKIVSILRPGGLFAFTCATTGCPEFGTRRFHTNRSLAALENMARWSNYFKPLTFEDLKAAIPLNDIFSNYSAYYNANSKDFMFVGIKKRGVATKIVIPDYRAPHVEKIISYPENGEFSIPTPAPQKVSSEAVPEKIQPNPEIFKQQTLASVTNPLPEIQPVATIKDSLNIVAPKITKKEMESIFNKIAEETLVETVVETMETLIESEKPVEDKEVPVEVPVEAPVEVPVENKVNFEKTLEDYFTTDTESNILSVGEFDYSHIIPVEVPVDKYEEIKDDKEDDVKALVDYFEKNTEIIVETHEESLVEPVEIISEEKIEEISL
jgi:SAM-dependent methyltransferase